jgi:hypothetical protein
MLVLRVKQLMEQRWNVPIEAASFASWSFALRNGGTRSNFVPEMRLRFGVVTSSDEWQVSW